MSSELHIEVAYALPDKQYLLKLKLPQGADIEKAIRESGLLDLRPEIDLSGVKTGIYSHPAPLNQVLTDGDRVEIYRPLLADPKELRRMRAQRISEKNNNLHCRLSHKSG